MAYSFSKINSTANNKRLLSSNNLRSSNILSIINNSWTMDDWNNASWTSYKFLQIDNISLSDYLGWV